MTGDPESSDASTAGAFGAAALVVGLLLVVTAPELLSPVLMAWLWPGAEWRYAFAWWWVPLGAVLFGAASLTSGIFTAPFRAMFPRTSQRPALQFAGGLTSIALLTGVYALVLTPVSAALAAALVAWCLDQALEHLVPRND